MTLTHIPAHTTNFPDRFGDETTGWGYSVVPDRTAEDPRGRITAQHAALWVFHRGPVRLPDIIGEKPDGNVAIDTFAHYYEHRDADEALALTRRYLAVFHPEKKIRVETATIQGDSSEDWLEVVAAVAEQHGTPERHIDQFRMWAVGDVWTVLPDGKPGIHGIYADDAAAALAYFRENFEDGPVGDAGGNGLRPHLGVLEARDTEWRVTWEIDVDVVDSPAQAAAAVWLSSFGRGTHRPGPDECCVFTVTDKTTGQSVTVDLSGPGITGIFEGGPTAGE